MSLPQFKIAIDNLGVKAYQENYSLFTKEDKINEFYRFLELHIPANYRNKMVNNPKKISAKTNFLLKGMQSMRNKDEKKTVFFL